MEAESRQVTAEDIEHTVAVVNTLAHAREVIVARFGGTPEGELLDSQFHVMARSVFQLLGLLVWTRERQGGDDGGSR